MRHAMTASRTTPTLCVLVIMIGPSRKPESSSQVVPVISPLPLSVNQAPKTGSQRIFAARKNGGDAGADRAFSDFELAAAGDERGVSDFYAVDVGDGVVRAGRAVEGDAEVAGSGLGLGEGESAGTEKSGREVRSRIAEDSRWHHRSVTFDRVSAAV